MSGVIAVLLIQLIYMLFWEQHFNYKNIYEMFLVLHII